MTILEKFKQSFEAHAAYDTYTIWNWASSVVFGLVTYDAGLDEIFVRKIIKVCKVILNNETFEYIDTDETNYTNYILVCQLLDKKGWINWGTSIRGAWFEPNDGCDLLIEDELWRGDKDGIAHIDLTVKFSKETLQEIINFIESED